MTSAQAGKTISALHRQYRRRGGKKAPQATPAARRRFAQTVVCGILFVTLVAVKLLLPAKIQRLSAALSGVLERNMDVTEAFSAVGRALSGASDARKTLDDVYQAVFRPAEDEAIPASADASAARDALGDLRAYADGAGDAGAWLGEAVRTQGQSAALPDETAREETDAAQPAQSAGEQAQTLELASILYSGETLPANVSLEQAVLGFSYCTPVSGTISSGFGYREHPIEGEERFHYGVDLAADSGTEIDCFADGTVAAVGESSSYGKYVTVSHAGGYSTLYAHCSAVCVTSGAAVHRGEKIAQVGQTGMATGPHLHFELHSGAVYLDPVYYVEEA